MSVSRRTPTWTTRACLLGWVITFHPFGIGNSNSSYPTVGKAHRILRPRRSRHDVTVLTVVFLSKYKAARWLLWKLNDPRRPVAHYYYYYYYYYYVFRWEIKMYTHITNPSAKINRSHEKRNTTNCQNVTMKYIWRLRTKYNTVTV
jgi:hypothetical protein